MPQTQWVCPTPQPADGPTNVRQSSRKEFSKTSLSGLLVSSSATTPSYTWVVTMSNLADPVGRTCILVAKI